MEHSESAEHFEFPEPTLLRAEEDYSALSNHNRARFLEKLKYIPLGKNPTYYLSIGGESRSQYEIFKSRAFGEEPDDDTGWLLQRFMLHTDWNIGKFRTFIQLQSSLHLFESDELESSAVDADHLDLHQGFVQYSFDLKEENQITARIGRQELWYGTRRLISVREGPNVRQTFDVAKVFYEAQNLQIDLFYAKPIRNLEGVFDNERISGERLWSAYAVIEKPGFIFGSLDAYYIGFQSDRRAYEQGLEDEDRHSIGIRHWGTQGRWRYNNEVVYQFGSFGSGNINAYTISIDASYKLSDSGWEPEIGLKTEIISGDKSIADDDLNTFNALYPRGAYFGLIAITGPANLIDFHPSISFSPIEHYEVIIDWDIFWRHRTQDGFYGPNAFLARAGSSSDRRYLGHQPGFEMARSLGRYWELSFEGSWFLAGSFFEETGESEDVLHFALTTKFKF